MIFEELDPLRLPLVRRMYKEHYPSGKAKSDELTIVGTSENKICCCVRFKTIEGSRLLTGMLVLPEMRMIGLGRQLLHYCAKSVLQSQDFCFAYPHLTNMYEAHGFTVIPSDELPNGLKLLFERYTCKKSLIPMQFVGIS